MSAALHLPMIWGASQAESAWFAEPRIREERPTARAETRAAERAPAAEPAVTLAFYRKHTENMLRRYLYASMRWAGPRRFWVSR